MPFPGRSIDGRDHVDIRERVEIRDLCACVREHVVRKLVPVADSGSPRSLLLVW